MSALHRRRIWLDGAAFVIAAFVAFVLQSGGTPAGAASSCVATNLLPASVGPYGCAADYTSLGAFTAAAGTTVFDTTALTYGVNSGGVEVAGAAVYVFDSIAVPTGATVRGVGTRPLVLMSKSGISVSGTVHVNGSNATGTAPSCQAFTASPAGAGGSDGGLGFTPGPGVGAPGAGAGGGGAPTNNAGGGGGAGFGGPGGVGGGGGGTAGAAYGDLAVALAGGSGGGAGSATGCSGASGGGGGGALLLSAVGPFVVNAGGAVRANGGNGALSDTGASGAGSGGGLVIVAPTVTNNGTISASGGQGGPGGCCGGGGAGGGGRILFAGGVVVQGTTSVAGGAASSGNGGGAAGSLGVISSVVNDPPVVICGTDLLVGATGFAGASVSWPSNHCTANDTETGALTCLYSIAAGSIFPIGVTTVTCTATDAAGLTGSDSFTVTVRPLPEVTLTWNPTTMDLEVLGSHPDGIASITMTSNATSLLVKSRVYTVTSNAGSVTTLRLDVTYLPLLGREEFTLRELRYGADTPLPLTGSGRLLWGSLGSSVVSLFQSASVPSSSLLGSYAAITGRSSMTLNGATTIVTGIRPFRITSQGGALTLTY